MNTENTARVDAYLDQVLAPLTRRLSRFQQGELRRELRAHLWERIDAYRELGHSEDEAVTEALKQFGGADDFLKQWRQEWVKTTPQATLREIGAAMRSALLLSLPALLIACGISEASRFAETSGGMVRGGVIESSVVLIGGIINYAALPLILGAAAGRLIPQRAVIGILAALTAELAFCWGIANLLYEFHGLNDSALSMFGASIGFSIFVCSAAWLPLACTSAALTGWWTQKGNARQMA